MTVSAAKWAAVFADLLPFIRSPDGPRARGDASDYDIPGLYQWDALGLITLLPLLKAGVAAGIKPKRAAKTK